jgi:MFS family permease
VAEQGFSRLQLGWVSSSNTLGLFGGALAVCTLSDRIGRRAVLAGPLLAFGLSSIETGLRSGSPDLTLMRFLTGLRLGAAFANLTSIIAEMGKPQSRAGRVTVVTAAIPPAGAVAALLVRFVEAFD